MVKDLGNNLASFSGFIQTTIGADSDFNGIVVDTQGYEGGIAILKVNTYTAGNVTPRMQEGDDAGGSDMADIPAERITTPGQTLSAANEHSKIGFLSNKRYVRIVGLGAGSANLTVTGQIVLGPPNHGAVDAHVTNQ